jgi:hypothetical protein
MIVLRIGLVALCSTLVAAFVSQPTFGGVHRSFSPSAYMAASQPSYEYALLFDCDGVILETEELHRLAYNAAFQEFGLTINGEPVNWSVRAFSYTMMVDEYYIVTQSANSDYVHALL